MPPRIESDLARYSIGTCSVIQPSLASPKMAADAPTMKTPAPNMNRFSAKRENRIPSAEARDAQIMALRSPMASTILAAGISAQSLPIIKVPVTAPAVARSAPRRIALAGMLGSIPYSAVEKRKEGRKTGSTSLRLEKVSLDWLTAQLSPSGHKPQHSKLRRLD